MIDSLEGTKLANLDIIIIAAYLAGCVIFGLCKTRGVKNITEYSIGRGSFPTSIVVATIFATFIGADMMIGIIGAIYNEGLLFVLVQMIAPLFWIIASKIFGENIDKFRGCLSISDIMEKLYGQIGRWITNIAALLFSIGLIAVQAAALGHMFNYFFPAMGYQNGVILATSVMILYSFSGGIKAVAMTDVFQLIVFFLAIPLACIIAYHDVGGFEVMKLELPTQFFSINLTTDNMWMYISLFFAVLLPDPSGTFMQRFLISKNARQLQHVLKIVAFLHFAFICILALIAYVVRTRAPEVNPDTALFYLINNYLPTGIAGLMVAGMLAVIMSTADSWLNTTGILCAHDIIKSIVPSLSEKRELLIARISTILIGVMATYLALSEGKSIFAMVFFAYNFWLPIILLPLSAGFIGLKVTIRSLIVSVCSAIALTACVGTLGNAGYGIESMIAGLIGSALGLACSTYLEKVTKRA